MQLAALIDAHLPVAFIEDILDSCSAAGVSIFFP